MSNKFVEAETPELNVLTLGKVPTVNEIKGNGYSIGNHYFLRVKKNNRVVLYHAQEGGCPGIEEVTREVLGKIADKFEDKYLNSLVWSLASYVG